MKYAFVSISILLIWLAIVIIAAVVPGFNIVFGHRLAIVATLILFFIGFRGK